MLSVEDVRKFFNYDPETGLITWRVKRSQNVRIGDLCGYARSNGYLHVGFAYGLHYAHRIAWMHFHGEEAPEYVDHIDGNRANNRIANLRAATRALNAQNVRRAYSNNKSSGLLGVYWRKIERRWQAKIQLNKKSYDLGFFDTKEAAHEAYLRAKRELHPFGTI